MRLLLSTCLLSASVIAGETVVGYRGDRNGDYPGCTPPTVWDEATKKNLAWKTVLPNWCYGMPIVVGQKVFVMSEPGWKSDFPELVCLDLETGKLLWQKQIDHLEQAVSDPKRREQIRAAWASLLERMRLGFNLVEESSLAGDDTAKQEKVKAKAVELLGEKAAQSGYSGKSGKNRFGNQSSAGGYGVLRGWGAGDIPGPDPKHQVGMKDLKAVGLRLETFYGFGKAREGECFSTPASDGKFVYVVTEQGAHAGFDLDGNLRWLTWIKPTFNPGGHDDSICRSPMVVDGLFITDLHVDRDTNKGGIRANPVIALDTATGKTIWQQPIPWGEGKGLTNRDHGCASSKIMEVGGTRVFVTSGGHVLRVKDGKPLATIVFSTPQSEIGTDDATDTVFYFPGDGQGNKRELVAVKLEFHGDNLNQKEIWRVPVKGVGHTMVVRQGKVYTGCEVADVATGKVTTWGATGGKGRVPTRWLLAIAGDHLYGLETDGTAQVFDLAGKLVATNKMLATTEDPDLIARHLAVDGNRQWEGKSFSYSSPFSFVGDRILMRSFDHLYCIRGK